MSGDLQTFIYDVAGHTQILVHRLPHCWPAALLTWSLTLIDKAPEYSSPILFDGNDIAKESVTLRSHHRRGQLVGWLYKTDVWNHGRWVEGIQHGNAIGLVERGQGELVDQSLFVLSAKAAELTSEQSDTDPTSEAEEDLCVERLDLSFLLLNADDPFQDAGIFAAEDCTFAQVGPVNA